MRGHGLEGGTGIYKAEAEKDDFCGQFRPVK